MRTLPEHWREYLIEMGGLVAFMVSAASFATLLNHPSSPLAGWTAVPVLRRLPMGVAMGLTAAAIIYSPWGRRSGAHLNPAVTITFLRLGRIAPRDALGYVAAQFAGGLAGIVLAVALLGGLPAHHAVNYVATVPGPAGAAVAAAAEASMSFVLMFAVLTLSSRPTWARVTGAAAATLVALFITFEDPLSGMSMNPARTLGPALLAGATAHLWVYFVAPLGGMLLAAEVHVRQHGRRDAGCAKLDHPPNLPCIFRCGAAAPSEVAA
jgi:aquaporin Z